MLSYSGQSYAKDGEYSYLIDGNALWCKYRGESFHDSHHDNLEIAKQKAEIINDVVNTHKFNILP